MTPEEQKLANEAYSKYNNVLRNGEVTANTLKEAYGTIDPGHVDRIMKIKAELDAQQAAGTKEYYSKGNMPSVNNATWDMAFRLSEAGLSSVQQLGRKTGTTQEYNSESGATQESQTEQFYNKATGKTIENWDHLSSSGGLALKFNYHFQPDGTVIPYTSKVDSDWISFRENVAKPIGSIVLAAYGVPALMPYMAAATGLAVGSAGLAAVTAGTVATTASMVGGSSFEEALKAGMVSGLTAGAVAGYADTIGQSLGFDAGSVASKAAGQAIISGAKAGITDQDVLTSMATGAVTSILSNKDGLVKASDEDLAAGLNPEYGSNQTYDAFMADAGFGFGEDATAVEGSLAKTVDTNTLDLTKTDITTGIKVAGVLMASNAVVNTTIGSTAAGTTAKQPKDIYRDAPLAGFKMVKYEDAATGSSKYVPYVGEEALLPPPTGYTKSSYAKGGFITKRK